MESLRTFIAIHLTPEIQDILKKIQLDLKKTGADVKWVQPHNIHLTLKFLGDVSLDKIDELKKVIQKSIEGTKAFEFQITSIGAFPKVEAPRVVWVGVNQGKSQIKTLADSLEKSLETIGFAKEDRDFEAHITLGRVRSSLNRFALSKAIEQYPMPALPSQKAESIVLFKSTLTPQGPIYESLQEFHFQ